MACARCRPVPEDRQVGRSKGHGLQSGAAERALVAAIAARPMLARRAVVVDMGAELGVIAEQRLELGGDRRFIGAGEGGRREGGRRRDGEKLDEEREATTNAVRGERRGRFAAERRRLAFGPDRPCGTPYAPARRGGKIAASGPARDLADGKARQFRLPTALDAVTIATMVPFGDQKEHGAGRKARRGRPRNCKR